MTEHAGDRSGRASPAGPLRDLLHQSGEATLDASDRAILRRLIRIRFVYDVPVPFDACSTAGSPFARGPVGHLDVLGLTHAEPATYALGETLISHLGHGGRVIRRYSSEHPEAASGEPLPVERR